MQNKNKSLGEINDFIDLEIYKLAEKIAVDIEKLLRNKKSLKRKWKAVDYTIEAAVSMGANIAEGFGRYFYKEKILFLFYTGGSICEVRSRLRHFYLVGDLTAEEIEPISNNLKLLNIKINNSITTTRQQIYKNKQ